MLVGAAGHWWESISRTRTEEQQRNLTWEQFKDKVMAKYFPQALRVFKESEFRQLRQGNLSLTDYERQFEQFSRYAPYLVDTEVKKIRRFENGLRPEIGMIIMSHRFASYREMLERAHAISYQRTTFEQYSQQSKESLGKRRWNDHSKDRCRWPNKRPSTGIRIGGTNGIIPPCPKSNTIITETGILSLSDVPAYVLFDSGATNSFISASFVVRSNFAHVKTNNELEVSIPSVRTLCTNQMTKAMKLEIDGKILQLGLNHATIRCHEREVLFHRSGEEEFHFFEAKFKSLPRLVSDIQAKRMLRKESCQGFLVNINGSKHVETTVKDINIVRDFVDAFSKDLPGIPQDRQVEFIIDLVPGVAPVSKALY
ncbi:uncharacterized protein LOC111382757 [Olea europaea var. sylvestris]|uniref:uncharacterized protein LOC111382757 n=1 Tax=Olea europaea var. sylvestris TaxID=158386 RepID=UPI000C1D814A|nr:uncharacterized protein LOC111382757 [Olea europaea var. sylvestris]